MADLVITKGKGGVSRTFGMTVVPPSREVPIEALSAVAKDAGLDGLVVADLVSAMAEHERAAIRFALSAARQTATRGLSQLHAGLAHAHASHLGTLESLMKTLGVNTMYASPCARMVHHVTGGLIAAPLLEGSVDAATMELALLDVALMMAQSCHDNTRALRAITAAAKPSTATEAMIAAVQRLEGDMGKTLEHVRSTRDAFVVAAATGKNTG